MNREMESLLGSKGIDEKGEAKRTSDNFWSWSLGRRSDSISSKVRGWKSCFLIFPFTDFGMLTINDCRP